MQARPQPESPGKDFQRPTRSINSLNTSRNRTRVALAEPRSSVAPTFNRDTTEIVSLRLQEAMVNAREHGIEYLELDVAFVDVIVASLESRKAQLNELKTRFDGIKVSHHVSTISY